MERLGNKLNHVKFLIKDMSLAGEIEGENL